MPDAIRSLYGAKAPAEVPVYTLADVAHHLGLSLSKVWALSGWWPYPPGQHDFRGFFLVASSEDFPRVSFLDLVPYHVLSLFLRGGPPGEGGPFSPDLPRLVRELPADFRLAKVKKLLKREWARFPGNRAAEATGHQGTETVNELVGAYLDRLELNDEGAPLRLYPFTRDRLEGCPRAIAIDPRVRFGQPCLAGKNIPTDILFERYLAGESVQDLAADYGVEVSEVEEAIRFEGRSAGVRQELILHEAKRA